MREIKFRAWADASEHGVRYFDLSKVDAGSVLFDDGDWISLSECEVEQFTGLKDKNGKEIYEGDWIKVTDRSYGTFAVPISYSPGHAGFIGRTYDQHEPVQISGPEREWDRDYPPCYCDGAMYMCFHVLQTGDEFVVQNDKIEVIGNIHENKELLTW